MREAYALGLPTVLSWKPYDAYKFESALVGTEEDLIYGICLEIRMDYANNSSLINDAFASGRLYRLMSAFLSYATIPQYTLDYVKAREGFPKERVPGASHARCLYTVL